MKYSNIFTFLLIITTQVVFGDENPNDSPRLTSIPYDSPVVKWGLGLETMFDVYPNEIRVGDTLYFGDMIQNASPNTFWAPLRKWSLDETLRPRLRMLGYGCLYRELQLYYPKVPYSRTVRFSRVGVPEHRQNEQNDELFYENRFESLPESDVTIVRGGHFRASGGVFEFPLESGRKIIRFGDSMECPPLEDWNHPFWQNIQREAPPEGVEVKVEWCALDPDLEDTRAFECVIRVKPRSQAEAEEIRNWLDTTPPELLPRVVGEKKCAGQGYEIHHGKTSRVPISLHSTVQRDWKDTIQIRGEGFCPYFFMPWDCRKPSGAGTPPTCEAWRALERRWTPGTMRDEMRLTRHLLEIFEHPGYPFEYGACYVGARAFRMDTWMETLPDVQRLVMLMKMPLRFRRDYASFPNDSLTYELCKALRLRYRCVNCWCETGDVVLIWENRVTRLGPPKKPGRKTDSNHPESKELSE